MIIEFEVKNQTIKRLDENTVVAGSKNYLQAKFNFVTPEWETIEKTARFTKDSCTYNTQLADDMCYVPAEVLKSGFVSVSVFGGDLITTRPVSFLVYSGGLDEGVPVLGGTSENSVTLGQENNILTIGANDVDIYQKDVVSPDGSLEPLVSQDNSKAIIPSTSLSYEQRLTAIENAFASLSLAILEGVESI